MNVSGKAGAAIRSNRYRADAGAALSAVAEGVGGSLRAVQTDLFARRSSQSRACAHRYGEGELVTQDPIGSGQFLL